MRFLLCDWSVIRRFIFNNVDGGIWAEVLMEVMTLEEVGGKVGVGLGMKVLVTEEGEVKVVVV